MIDTESLWSKHSAQFWHIPTLALVVLILGSGACAKGVIAVGGGAQGGGVNGGAAGTNAGGAAGAATIAAPDPVGTALVTDATLCSAGQIAVGRTPLRRLSRVEYNNMVRDLLGDKTQPASSFVSEEKVVGFNSNSYSPVTSALIPKQYLDAAEALAAAAVSDANTLGNLLGCGAQQDDACAQKFIDNFGARAFRAPLDASVSAALMTLYKDIKGQFDFATGIQAVITDVLTSPRFLFVLEFGQGGATGKAVALSPYELATRLALYLWRSIPDQALLQAAAGGNLATPADVATQATRMLADDRAKDALNDFTSQWMGIENMASVTKDTQFTKWTPALADDLKTETLTTVSAQVLTENGTFTDLLTSPFSYVNANLASNLYGVSATGSGFTRTNINPDPAHPTRAGVLSQGSVLAAHAHTSLPSPVLRGKLVRERILCDVVLPPPAGLKIAPPPTSLPPGSTTRAQFAAHAQVDPCRGCHQFMDPLGFAFSHYDATGAYQTQDNGQAVDATGMINATAAGNLTGAVDGAVDLAQKLAGSTQAQACFLLEQFRYATGRVETNQDACSAQQAFKAFSDGQFNVKKLLVALVSSDAFRYRTVVSAGEACQ